MNQSDIVYLTESSTGVPYYILQFEDYELPLFGENFSMGVKSIPNKGDVCSRKLNRKDYGIVGKFRKSGDNISVFLYQIGDFIATATERENFFEVSLLPPPADKLKFLAFESMIKIPIPKDTELYKFITS